MSDSSIMAGEVEVIDFWHEASALLVQSQRVIGLRMAKLALGGQGARDEAFEMVEEKVKASVDAIQMVLSGVSGHAILAHYNGLVAANLRRLDAR